MKRSIIITLALIAAIAVPLCASSGWARGLGVLGMMGGAGGAAASYLLSEDFSGENAPDGWSPESAYIDYDYVDGAVEWLRVTSGTAIISASSSVFTASSDVHLAFKFKPTVLPSISNSPVITFRNGGTDLAYIRTSNTGYIRGVVPGAIGVESSAGLLVAGTEIYIQARYQAGSGSNAKLSVWYSSDGSAWNSAFSPITTGNSTAGAAYVSFLTDTSGPDYQFRAVRVSDEFINY